MLADSQVTILLTQQHLAEALPQSGAQVIFIDADWESSSREGSEPLASGTVAENAIYVMYTSGSTGIPKGIIIPHRAVTRLVLNTDYVELGPNDIVIQFSNSS